MAAMIKLVSNDGEILMSRRAAERSQTIKNMLEDMLPENVTPIPVTEVNKAMLEKVAAWCEHYKDGPAETTQQADPSIRQRTDDITQWDLDFMNVEQGVLFDILKAANYLEIPSLLTVGCKTLANMLKGKSPVQIRQEFGIHNAFTAEEEEQLRKENEWSDADLFET